MIIAASNFIGEYNIPNRSSQDVKENIEYYIKKYEPKLLTQLLGAALYQSLITGLGVEDPESTYAKWIALRDLVTPSILGYVYWYYRKDNITDTTQGGGESKGAKENGTTVSPGEKMADRWNDMVDNNQKVVMFIKANTSDYGTYAPQWYTSFVIDPSSYRGDGRQRLPDIFCKQNNFF